MARAFDDASSEYLEYAGAVVGATPLALSCWFYSDDLTVSQNLLGIQDAGTAEFCRIGAMGSVGGDPIRAQITGGNVADTSTGYAANAWHHACGIFATSTDRRAFIDGGSKGTSTGSQSFPATPDVTVIGRRSDSTPVQYMSGRIAEAAIWDLSGWPGASDPARADSFETIALPSLALGYSPLFYPLGLVGIGYWRLLNGDGDQDLVGDANMTAFNTPSYADHPPKIIYPAPPFINFPSAAVGNAMPMAMQQYRIRRVAA